MVGLNREKIITILSSYTKVRDPKFLSSIYIRAIPPFKIIRMTVSSSIDNISVF